jgi:hypothetical protein
MRNCTRIRGLKITKKGGGQTDPVNTMNGTWFAEFHTDNAQYSLWVLERNDHIPYP